MIGALLLSACERTNPEDADPRVGTPDVSVSEAVGTVLSLRWDDDADSAWVEVTGGDSGGHTGGIAPAPAERGDDGSWRAVLFGLHASSDYTFAIHEVYGDEEATGAPTAVTTGPLPEQVVPPTVTDDGNNDGYYALGVISSAPMAQILDADGVPVWWWAIPEPSLLVTRVARASDGRSVWVSCFKSIDETVTDGLAIYRVAYDGTLLETIETVEGHHDFLELPDGSVAWLDADPRRNGIQTVRGDTLMERAPDGTVREVWNVWDWYDLETVEWEPDITFAHANALQYDAESDVYWISLRQPGSMILVDRATGIIVETLLGLDSTWPLVSGVPMSYQHGFRLLDDGFVVMDDREIQGEVSRGVQFTVDRPAGTIRQAWEFPSDEELHINGLGDVARTPDGDTLLVWSSAGEVQRVSPSGETLWRINSDIGTAYGYLQWTADGSVLPRE